jgi:ubiquinone/menaquinone biosynthesis C-methylase UbiE
LENINEYRLQGWLIYDANIYDGLNTFLSDLQFYKKWLPKNKEAEILELCCGTGRLTIPIAKDGYNENSEKQIYVLTLNDNKVLYEKIQNQR